MTLNWYKSKNIIFERTVSLEILIHSSVENERIEGKRGVPAGDREGLVK